MTFAEENKKQIIGVILLSSLGALFGYIAAQMLLSVWHKEWATSSPFFLLTNYLWLYERYYTEWLIATLLIVLPFIGGLLLSTRMLEPALTQYGSTRWQTKKDLKASTFLANPATGFMLGKTAPPEKSGDYIVSAKHPHCILVAPTGTGKTVGFVIPNLLTFLGSVIVLDVKGECFEKTSRFRDTLGHKVFRFAPCDYDAPTHRWNPLKRIGAIKNPAQRMAEIDRLATLFLDAKSSQAESFLPNSKDVFVACAILAYERGSFTLGTIYKLVYGGDAGNNDKFAAYAQEVKDQTAKLLFQKMANTAKDTLSAYLSILSSSGFAPWANPHLCAVTAENDFDFTEFRRTPHSVYLTVSNEDLKTIAPLVRMFFSEAISALQHHEPKEDEPFPVMLMMDEFQRIGRMQIIVDSVSLLRSYGGHVAIVTQSIPDLDRVYGVEDRKALQASCGVKLYLTPSEEDTIGELSESVGTTTKKVTTRSRSMRDGVFGANITERSEEYPLLTKDNARRLPPDDIVIVVNGAMPIKAKRLQYYSDKNLKSKYDSQDLDTPAPMPKHIVTIADYQGIQTVETVKDQVKELQEAKSQIGNKPSEDIAQQKVTMSLKERIASAKKQADLDDKAPTNKAIPQEVLAGKGAQIDKVSNDISRLFAQANLAVAQPNQEGSA